MIDAILFSDAHAGEQDTQSAQRLLEFLETVCPEAKRVFILGDLFNFWFGPKQALWEPYRTVLGCIQRLADGGTEVVFCYGNRDFYLDEKIAGKFHFKIVPKHTIETFGSKRTLLCHGDGLCANDTSYRIMRRLLDNCIMRSLLSFIPVVVARGIGQFYRNFSSKTAKHKPAYVIEPDEKTVLEHFALGADRIVIGHTHKEGKRIYDTPDGPGEMYNLGDFGKDGSYVEVNGEDFNFKKAF